MKLITWCCLLVVGTFGESFASLKIALPTSLAKQYPGGVMLQPAMFGAPMQLDFHAKGISGPLAYAPYDDANGCNPIDKVAFANAHPNEKIQDIIVMVDRGSCDFTLKVQHVQDLGAKAAIIVDNQDEDFLPFMADDGNGTSITIPSILIRKKDGLNISTALKAETVIVILSWNIPAPDNNVQWELWTTSVDTSDDFKRNFDEAEKVFGNSTQFTPHFMIVPGLSTNCINLTATTAADLPCGTDCTNNGRYCDYSYSTDYTGADIIAEDLRQICLWSLLAGGADELMWWDYVQLWQDSCLNKKNVTEKCSVDVLSRVRTGAATFLVPKWQQCAAGSGGADLIGGNNTFLEREIVMRTDRNIMRIPQVLINGMPYYGGLSCPSPPDIRSCKLLSTLCLGFKDPVNISACTTEVGCPLGTRKDVCGLCGGGGSFDACGLCWQPFDKQINQSCLGCDKVPNSQKVLDVCGVCEGPGRDACQNCGPNPVMDVNDCYAVDTETTGLPVWAVVLIVVGCIMVVAVGVFFFMQHRQNALKQDIDALMKQYLPMDSAQNT